MATAADGTAERDAALLMLHRRWRRAPRRRTVGADKAYDTYGLVEVLRELDVTPHVAQNLKRRGGSAIDARTTRHDGYAKSLHARPRIEPAFGWLKTIAWMRKVKLRGLAKVDWLFRFASAAFNLRRLVTLRARRHEIPRRRAAGRQSAGRARGPHPRRASARHCPRARTRQSDLFQQAPNGFQLPAFSSQLSALSWEVRSWGLTGMEG